MKELENREQSTFEGMPFVSWVRIESGNESNSQIQIHLFIEVPDGLKFNKPEYEDGNYIIKLTRSETSGGGSFRNIVATFENEIISPFTIFVFRDSELWHSVNIGEISAATAESIVLPEHVAAPFIYPVVDNINGNITLLKVHTVVFLPDNTTIIRDFEPTITGYEMDVEWEGEVNILNLHRNEQAHDSTFGLEHIIYSVRKGDKKKKVLVSTSDGTIGIPK